MSTRKDGLSTRAVGAIAQYVATRMGARILSANGRYVRLDAAESAAPILEEIHGIKTRREGAITVVDLLACPPGATPAERLVIADQLARTAGYQAAAEWRARVDAGESPVGRSAVEAATAAAEEEFAWASQQTLARLRWLVAA